MMSFYCNGMKGICTEMKTTRYCPMDCKFSDGTGGHHVETNGDRIRAMTDEELAEFLCGVYDEEETDKFICGTIIPNYYEEAICDWLKQPCEVDHDAD